MFEIFLNNVLFILLAVFPTLSLSFIYEDIFYLNPMNSMIGIPLASSFALPITFLLDASKFEEFSR